MQSLKRIPATEDTGGALGFTRTVSQSTLQGSRAPRPGQIGTVPSRSDWFVGLAISAGISACVSLLALWLWSQNQAPASDAVGQLTITYEPLDAVQPASTTAAPTPSPEGESQRDRETAAAIDAGAPAAAARPAQPARAATAGTPALVVISQPEGARVTINGLGYGSTPLTVAGLPPGTKRLRISKAGYTSEERIVGADTTRAGVTLRITMREDPGPPR
jgi:hypothetical protein